MKSHSSTHLCLLLLIGSLAGFRLYYALLTDWIQTLQWSSLSHQPTGLMSRTIFLLLYTSLAILFGIKKITFLRRR